jgi:hypothetical protein
MFVNYFDYVARPFDAVAAALCDTPARWLTGCMTQACREAAGLEHETAAGADVRPWLIARVTVAPPDREGAALLIPLRVEIQGPDAPFASLEADLEAGEVGPSTTQLRLRGSYLTRPSGIEASGSGRDAGLVQRIAEAAVKGFVERVAARVAVVQVAEQSNGAGGTRHRLQRI